LLSRRKTPATNAKKLLEEYTQSLDKIRTLQQQFIPQNPVSVNNYNISSFYRPAHIVSGDLCFYVALGTNKIGIVVIDIIGKGISACFITVCLKYIFQSIIQVSQSPKEVMSAINTALCTTITLDNKSGYGFYGVLDTVKNTLTYCNCGVGVAKLFSKGNVTELRDYGGFALGGIENTVYTEGSVTLNSGDVVIIATDGLEDVKNSAGKRLGTEWLDGFMANRPDDNTHDTLANQIDQAIHTQTGCRSFLEDDIACVCIENF
jgi:sigma-B regulation protein RsbU (phosphoserine phosphatase)